MGSSPRMRGTRQTRNGHAPVARILWTTTYKDHPRGCGEHRVVRCRSSASAGSSPRMRGTLGCDRHADRFLGIIPADAGNTPRTRWATCWEQDHPRGCGEHMISPAFQSRFRGSSPRMRGTRRGHLERLRLGGIIPADAGNTILRACSMMCGWDHPRGCGEHRMVNASLGSPGGSSPRMRGTHELVGHGRDLVRIIPADAGNTSTRYSNGWGSRDHPRGCGEHACIVCYFFPDTGSSPRMRGTPVVLEALVGPQGIIPADAGNTGKEACINGRSWDHPRGCGEHLVLYLPLFFLCGSSPRMRGTLKDCGLFPAERRIIPADAGNTDDQHQGRRHWRDHPRGCGEHSESWTTRSQSGGSSPRMRGTRFVASR